MAGFVSLVLIFFIALAVLAVLGLRVANEYERAVVFRLGRLQRTRGPGTVLADPLGHRAAEEGRPAHPDHRRREPGVDHEGLRDGEGQRRRVAQDRRSRQVGRSRSRTSTRRPTRSRSRACATSSASTCSTRCSRSATRSTTALQLVVDAATEPWGVKVEMVEMKDVEIPVQMQRAMAQEAQAIREKRARIIKAEAEQEAAAKLAEAAHHHRRAPARARAAPHADDHRGRRRAEHDHHRHDAERVRHARREPGVALQGAVEGSAHPPRT